MSDNDQPATALAPAAAEDPSATKTRRLRRMARPPSVDAAAPGSDSPARASGCGTAPSPAKASKTELVLALLRREEGATLAELTRATGWLPHSTRAALTGLRKRGHTIGKGRRGEVTCYAIKESAE